MSRPLRPFVATFALGACAATWCGIAARAQGPAYGPLDYSHNWAPMHGIVDSAFAGPALFGLFTGGGPNYAGPGDAIRYCYGFDVTQGGRNQSAGVWESAWFKLVQAYAPGNAIPGVDIGAVRVFSVTDSDPNGDPCFAPFFSSPGNTGGMQVSASLTPGLVAFTAGQPFPKVWELAFQWTGPGVGPHGLTGPATIGTDLGGGGRGNPLLTSVVLEVNAPPTGGPLNNQYYFASTTETPGISVAGTGGITNGHVDYGKSLFGMDAIFTGELAHTRFTVQHPLFGLVPASPIYFERVGDTEFAGHMAFQSPVLWAEKDGFAGSGATDWKVSAEPVSEVDLRLLDQLSGAQTNANVAAKHGGNGAPAVAYDPQIVFNRPIFLWSASSALGMQQQPTSWDDLGGLAFPAQPGSIALGGIATSREGVQRVPIVLDALTTGFLAFSGITLGTPFSASEDPLLDGMVTDGLGVSHSSLFEGVLEPLSSGSSGLQGGPLRLVEQPAPELAGATIGVCALGLQIRSGPGGAVLLLTEFSSGLEINLQ